MEQTLSCYKENPDLLPGAGVSAGNLTTGRSAERLRVWAAGRTSEHPRVIPQSLHTRTSSVINSARRDKGKQQISKTTNITQPPVEIFFTYLLAGNKCLLIGPSTKRESSKSGRGGSS